ncbi:DUF4442 domain-containing protein [Sagittula sp. SSi028]|uniref:DUF4442 domain-containing protein n=1 Tax=Sagittula sp. SSi028 TaxID=3400636 RepID=UPI003AF7B197
MNRPDNQLNGVLERIAFLPEGLRLRAFDFFFGRLIRAYRSLRIRTRVLTPTRVEMELRNMRKIRNHVGGIHGVIAQVPGEFAAGVLIAHWTPKGAVVVVKSMQANLYKPVKGDVRAIAQADAETLRAVMDQEKGELTVAVEVIDETGESPMSCDVTMAWVPRGGRKSQAQAA